MSAVSYYLKWCPLLQTFSLICELFSCFKLFSSAFFYNTLYNDCTWHYIAYRNMHSDYIHPRKKAVAFEMSCIYSVVYVFFKMMEKVLLLSSNMLKVKTCLCLVIPVTFHNSPSVRRGSTNFCALIFLISSSTILINFCRERSQSGSKWNTPVLAWWITPKSCISCNKRAVASGSTETTLNIHTTGTATPKSKPCHFHIHLKINPQHIFCVTCTQKDLHNSKFHWQFSV